MRHRSSFPFSQRLPRFSRRAKRLILTNTVAGLLVSLAFPSLASINIFNGSINSSWANAGNWSLSHVPNSIDGLFFNSSTTGNSQLNNSWSTQTLSFDTGSDSFGIDANFAGTTTRTLVFVGGTNANGGADLISLSANTTGTITLGGANGVGVLNLDFNTAHRTGTINVANSAATLVIGANAHLIGSNGITKNGAGTLQILSTNTYTGGTAINAGVIAFANGSLGSGTITLNGGGLQWVTGNTQDISGQLATIGSGGATFDTNGQNITFNSVFGSAGTVTKTGAGTLTLPNAPWQQLQVNQGTVNLTASSVTTGGIQLNGGNLTFSNTTTTLNAAGVIQLYGINLVCDDAMTTVTAGGLQLNGGGNLIFGKAMTTVSLGGLSSNSTTAIFPTQNGSGAPMAVTLGSATNFAGMITGNGSIVSQGGTLSGDNSGFNGGFTVNAGTLQIASSTALGTGTVTLNGGTLTFVGQPYFSAGALAASNSTLVLQNNSRAPVYFTVGSNGASTTFSGILTGDFDRPQGTLIKVGTGTLTLTNSDYSTANITLMSGTLDVSADPYLLGAGALQINGGALAFGNLTSSSVGALTGSGNLVLTNANNQGVTFTVGMTLPNWLFVGFSLDTPALETFYGAITGLGTLVMNGSAVAQNNWNIPLNILHLGGSGSTANITLLNGTIYIQSSGALGSGTFTDDGGTLSFVGPTTAAAGALAGTVNLALLTDAITPLPVTFIVGSNGASTTFSGALTGSGTLVKVGSGTLTLTGTGSTANITLNSGAIDISASPTSLSSGVFTYNGGNLIFGGQTSISVGGLAGSSDLVLTNASNQGITFIVGGNGANTTYTGAITGLGTLVMNGPSTLALTNPNSTAGIVLAGGSLDISQNGSALGSGTFGDYGGTLNFGSLTAASAGALAGPGNLSLLNNSSQPVTFTVGDNGASTEYSGALTGGTLVKNGTGALRLSGTGSTANFTLNNGTIDLSSNATGLGTGTFTINSGSLYFGAQTSVSAGALAGSGGLELTNASNQGVTFTVGGNNSSTTYTGALTGSGSLIKTGSGTLALSNPNSTANITLASGTLDISQNSYALGTGTFTYNGGTLNFGSLTAASAGALAGTGNLSLLNNSSQPVTFTVCTNGASTVYSGTLTGGTLIMNGTGTLGLSGPGSTANITLNNGTIDLSSSATDLGTGTFTINGGNLYFGAQTSASAGALAGSGGLVLTNASNQAVAFTVGGNGTNTTYTGAVTGLGTLVKTGSGALALSDPNSTAGITLSQGILDISANGSALGSGTFTDNGGTLNFGSLTAVSAGALAGTANLSLLNNSSQPVTFTVGSNGASTTYSGALAGGTLVKTGAGTMTLTGSVSSGANLTLANGTLDISLDSAALQSGTFTINGGALNLGTLTSVSAGGLAGSGGLVLTNASSQAVTFTVTGNNSTNYSGAVTGLGSLVMNGTGTLALSNSNSTVNITQSQGTLDISQNGNALGSGTFTINGGTLFTGSQTSVSMGALAGAGTVALQSPGGQPIALTTGGNGASTTFSGLLNGSGSVIKAGAGTWTLTTANSYTGGTTINGGAIVSTSVGASSSVLGTGPVTVGANSLLTGVGFIPGATTVNGFLSPGSPIGTLNFGNSLTFSSTGGYQVTLGFETPGTGYSQVFVQNQINLAGTLSITFASGFVPNIGDKFFILDTIGSSAVTGTFRNPAGGALNQITVNGMLFHVTYNDSNSDGGANDVSLTYQGPTPFFYKWSGAGADTNFGTGANWQGNSVPPAGNSGVELVFSGSGTGAFLTPVNNLTNLFAGSISIEPGSGNFVLSGQPIPYLGSSGVTCTRAGTQTINNQITLGLTGTWTIGNGSTLLMNGNLSGTGSPTLTKTGTGTLILAGTTSSLGGLTIGAGTLQLGNGGTTGTLPASMSILDRGNLAFNFSRSVTEGTDFGSISGSGTVTQGGPGTVFLTANTYTGGTIVTGGVINFGSSGLGTGPITLNGGGLQWSTALGISSQLVSIGSLGGTLDTNGNSVTINSVISGAGPLTKTGIGALTLNVDSSGFSGGFTVLQDSLIYGSTANALGTGTITLSGGTLGFNQVTAANAGGLAGTGNIVLTNASNQPVTFTVGGNGASTTYSGSLSGLGLLIKSGTGTFTLAGDSTGSVSEISIAQGTVALATPNAAAGYTLSLDGGNLSFGSLTSATASELTGSGSLLLANVTNQSVAFTVGGDNNSTTYAGALTGTGTLIKTGTGTLTLGNAGSTAATTLNAGVIDFDGNPNALGAGTFTINGGTVNFDSLTAASVGALAGSGPLVLTNSNNQPVNLTVGTNGASTTYSGTLAGLGFLTMNGTGTLTLAGDSTNASGTVSITQGTVALATSNAAAGYTLGLNGGTLSFGSLTSAAAAALQGSGSLVLQNINNQAVAFTLGGNNSSTTYTGALTGSGTLIKTGSGTLALSNPNSTAGITLSQGILDLSANGSALGSGTFTDNGGTLNFGSLTAASAGALAGTANLSLLNNSSQPITFTVGSNGASTTYSGALAGGTLVKTGTGTMTLTGSISSGANLTLVNGTLDISLDGTALQSGTFTINGGALNLGTLTSVSTGGLAGSGGLVLTNASNQAVTFTVTGNNSTNYTGAVTGLGSLVMNGTGALALSNSNSTANITLTQGILDISQNGNALGLGTFTTNGGTLFTGSQTSVSMGALAGFGPLVLTNSNTQPINFTAGSNGASTTYSGTLSGLGSLIKTGTGTLTLTGDSTGVLSTVSIAQGTLALATSNAAAGYTLGLNGGTLSFGSSTSVVAGGLSGNGTLTLTNANNQAVTFTVGGNNASTTFNGALTGLGMLVKTGSGTLTLNNSESLAAITLAGGTLQIPASSLLSSASAITLTGGTLNLGSLTNNTVASVSLQSGSITSTTGTLYSTSDYDIQSGSASAILAGNVNLNKTTAGTVTLTGANTYTGVTTITNGILSVSNLTAGGAASSIGTSSNAAANLVINGATLQYTNGHVGVTQPTDRLFTMGTAGATLDSSGGGSIFFTNTGAVVLSGTNTARTFTLSGTGIGGFVPVIGDNGTGQTSLTKSGTGIWTLDGASTYTGVTTVNAGMLFVALANGGTPSSIGASSNAAANLVLQDGTNLKMLASTTDRLFTINGSVSLEADDSVQFTNPGTIAFSAINTPCTVILTTPFNNASVTASFAPAIGDNGTAPTSLLKRGAGAWALTGTNTYTGSTTINSGELVVSGSLNGTTGVNVATNAILGGTGTIALANGSAFTLQSGARLMPGSGTSNGFTINATGGGSATLNLQNNSALWLTIANNQAGSFGAPSLNDYSKLTLGPNVSATLSGQLVALTSGTVNNGDVFVIIDSSTAVSGMFSDTGTAAPNSAGSAYLFTFNGQQWEINYAWTGNTPLAGMDFNSFAQVTGGTNVALLAIPEPGSMLSLLGGSALLLGWRRRKVR
ncbi:autotransporter-associated beta strand repeat protein [Chthoniobacter flavus Ellin428]|uniref:Autotransporter-associated beta strand repeat protein n=1 Tax=Chthoniobacter flavus Ellin428 TaxID=497964 RepID=B4D996_9BACT|nr:autotransporter-associated beta strand repeat-containing protein [Chthoniobacter flavus]EDY16999.1 autotransporter-associated beta strand repeat protein [Chthoniobacter flavus Ellin428]TCO86084.1 autotransporter-associated beta strand protein [Chthoniobacter flavus]